MESDNGPWLEPPAVGRERSTFELFIAAVLVAGTAVLVLLWDVVQFQLADGDSRERSPSVSVLDQIPSLAPPEPFVPAPLQRAEFREAGFAR